MEKVEQEERDEQAETMARSVREATLHQIRVQLQNDLSQLRARTPDKMAAAIATARDVKYIRDRQKLLG